MDLKMETITINGVDYVRADQVKPAKPVPTGNRYVVVLDRGWILAGDLTEFDGRTFLERVVNVERWESFGLGGMLREPKSTKVKLNAVDQVTNFPTGSELFRIHVADNWGL